MDQNDKKSMEYKLGSFLRKLRSGDPDAYQTFRKNVFYGILLVGVALFIYQPLIRSYPIKGDILVPREVIGHNKIGTYDTGQVVTEYRWDFTWNKEEESYGRVRPRVGVWVTDWSTLASYEAAIISFALIFLGITKKN